MEFEVAGQVLHVTIREMSDSQTVTRMPMALSSRYSLSSCSPLMRAPSSLPALQTYLPYYLLCRDLFKAASFFRTKKTQKRTHLLNKQHTLRKESTHMRCDLLVSMHLSARHTKSLIYRRRSAISLRCWQMEFCSLLAHIRAALDATNITGRK